VTDRPHENGTVMTDAVLVATSSANTQTIHDLTGKP
jgi:hypothetical protein